MRQNNHHSYKKSGRNQYRKKWGLTVTGIAIILIIFAIFYHPKPDYKYISQWTKEDGIHITLKDEGIPGNYLAINEGDFLAFPLDFVKDYIDETIFWDEASEKLTITNTHNVIRMSTDDLKYFVNNEPLKLNMPVYTENNTVYIPQDTLELLYRLKCTYHEKEDIVTIDSIQEEFVTDTVVKKRVKVYENADKKSYVMMRLPKSATVSVYGEEGEFTKIRTEEGIPGYVFTKHLTGQPQVQAPEEVPMPESIPDAFQPEKGKINMVWLQVFNLNQSASEDIRQEIQGLDVVSPTWFSIADGEGNINNLANQGYVTWAHEQGYQVWPLFSNNLDSDSPGQIAHEALSNTDTREKMIKQILAFVALYDLDGINIDFESLRSEDGKYYLQFIREITPMLKQQGVTVSVDRFIPSPWTEHYQMPEVGKIVDYVVVMAYDEHYGGSTESGSTASIPWVENAIKETLKEIPKEKLIMGLPFYTRKWQETQTEDGLKVTSKAMGMDSSYQDLVEHGVTPVLDKNTGQNYGEYEEDGSTYKIWLEDMASLEARLNIAVSYDVAGTAGWKLSLASPDVWSIIAQHLGK